MQNPGHRHVRLQWATRGEAREERDRKAGNAETRDQFEAHARRFF
jgi:hypothetical protein